VTSDVRLAHGIYLNKENTMKTHNQMLLMILISIIAGASIAIGLNVKEIKQDLNDWIIENSQTSDTAPPTDTWVEPYGGCKEAAANPGTPGYEQCAARGLVP
jgi:hypothetical protein